MSTDVEDVGKVKTTIFTPWKINDLRNAFSAKAGFFYKLVRGPCRWRRRDDMRGSIGIGAALMLFGELTFGEGCMAARPTQTQGSSRLDAPASSVPGQAGQTETAGHGQYKTALGMLTDGAVREAGAQFEVKNGNVVMREALYRVDAAHAFAIQPPISVGSGSPKQMGSKITFVRDDSKGVWLATDGLYGEVYGAPAVFEGQTVRVIGGRDTPLKIAGAFFSDTTLEITNGQPVKVAATNPAKHGAEGTLASYKTRITGKTRLVFQNPNEFPVRAALRSGERGVDIEVAPHASTPVGVAGGKEHRYRLYQIYANEPDKLYHDDHDLIFPPSGEVTISLVSPRTALGSQLLGKRPEAPDLGRPGNSPLPAFREDLVGANEVRVKNPNEFGVLVGVRSGERGRDFEVAAHGEALTRVPDGAYEIFFVYSTEPQSLYQGDGFTLKGTGVEIQIVRVVEGNYGIRRVR